jgi:hypothetical protein
MMWVMRVMLYEAAQSMLHSKKWSWRRHLEPGLGHALNAAIGHRGQVKEGAATNVSRNGPANAHPKGRYPTPPRRGKISGKAI